MRGIYHTDGSYRVTVLGGSTGTFIPIDPVRATTSTNSSVAGSASSILLLAANASRKQYSIYNDSTAILYMLEGPGTASTTNYTWKIAAGGGWINDEYSGSVQGIWASATGTAHIRELTP